MELSISISEILVAILIIIASGLGFIIKEQKEKIKSIISQLSDKKYHLYYDIYSLLFDIIKTEKEISKKQNEKELAKKIIDIKKDLLIYAPDPIVNKFIEWNRYVSNNTGDIKHAKIFFDLYILIRKDMGHPKSLINKNDILMLIMSTDIEIQQMKTILEFE